MAPKREITPVIREAHRLISEAGDVLTRGDAAWHERFREINPRGYGFQSVIACRCIEMSRIDDLLVRFQIALDGWERGDAASTDAQVLTAARHYWAAAVIACGEDAGLDVSYELVGRMLPDDRKPAGEKGAS